MYRWDLPEAVQSFVKAIESPELEAFAS